MAKEMAELERLRNLTEEERRVEFQKNPKEITNKIQKGKYKFMQKYYHRGAFFLEKEEDVLKRDTTGATLEDRFDKTVSFSPYHRDLYSLQISSKADLSPPARCCPR